MMSCMVCLSNDVAIIIILLFTLNSHSVFCSFHCSNVSFLINRSFVPICYLLKIFIFVC